MPCYQLHQIFSGVVGVSSNSHWVIIPETQQGGCSVIIYGIIFHTYLHKNMRVFIRIALTHNMFLGRTEKRWLLIIIKYPTCFSVILSKIRQYGLQLLANKTYVMWIKPCIWDGAWQNQQNDLCAQRRLASAWAFSCGKRRLIRLGGCPGWSESLLGAQVILLVLSCAGSYEWWSQDPDDGKWQANSDVW